MSSSTMLPMSMSMSNSHFPAKGMPKSPPKTCGFLKYDKKIRSLPNLRYNGTVTALNRPGSPQGNPTMYQSTMHAGSTIMQQSSSIYGMGNTSSVGPPGLYDAWPMPSTAIIIDLEDKELTKKSRQGTMGGKVVLRHFDPSTNARVSKMKKSLRVSDNYNATETQSTETSMEDTSAPSLVASFSKCRDNQTDSERTRDFGTNTELTQMRKLEFPEFSEYTAWINTTVDITVKALRKDVVAKKPADVLDFIIAWCVARKTLGAEPDTYTSRTLAEKPKPTANRVTADSSVIGRERPRSGSGRARADTKEHHDTKGHHDTKRHHDTKERLDTKELEHREQHTREPEDYAPTMDASRPSTDASGVSEEG